MHAVWLENINSGEIILQEGLDKVFHPASLLKLFTAVVARDLILCPVSNESCEWHRAQVQKHKTQIIAAIAASLKDSDNDALHYLVDFISETQSGLELEAVELEVFIKKRMRTQELFAASALAGLQLKPSPDLRIPNKCFEFDYYGRDRQLRDKQANQCNVKDVAIAMKLIMATSGMEIDLAEMIERESTSSDYQAQNFISASLGLREKFYSKAGWTSKVRHDACVFTRGAEQYLAVLMTDQPDPKQFQDLVQERLSVKINSLV